MGMLPDLRRITFTTHIVTSLGWAGAAFAFLVTALIGVTSPDERTVRGAYLHLIGRQHSH